MSAPKTPTSTRSTSAASHSRCARNHGGPKIAAPQAKPSRTSTTSGSAPTGADPDVVLVREGYAWGAAIFGPPWFLAHRLWLAALVDLVLVGVFGALIDFY